jgi:ribosomal protein L37AE/L43A
MSVISQPVRMTCTFCGLKQVARQRYPQLGTYKCEQCGCDKLHHHAVNSFERLISWIKTFFYY